MLWYFFYNFIARLDHIVIKVASAESGREGSIVMVIFVLRHEFWPMAYRENTSYVFF